MKIDTYYLDENNVIKIAPSLGCNAFSWKVNGREIFYKSEDFSGGNPILFPSVGRTWDFSEQTPVEEHYRYPGYKNTFKMPLHGIVNRGNWIKQKEEKKKDSHLIEYTFIPEKDVITNNYPFDITLHLQYTLSESKLSISAIVFNNGETSAPFSFGLHPFFKTAEKREIQLKVPCRKIIELHKQYLIPTGKQHHFNQQEFFLNSDKDYDTAFGSIDDNYAMITDFTLRNKIRIEFDSNIEMLILFSPADSPFICLEPWTAGLGGFSYLNTKNFSESNLLFLEKGKEMNINVTYSIEKFLENNV